MNIFKTVTIGHRKLKYQGSQYWIVWFESLQLWPYTWLAIANNKDLLQQNEVHLAQEGVKKHYSEFTFWFKPQKISCVISNLYRTMKEHNWFKDEKIYYWNHNLDKVLTEENKNCQVSNYIWYICKSERKTRYRMTKSDFKPFSSFLFS